MLVKVSWPTGRVKGLPDIPATGTYKHCSGLCSLLADTRGKERTWGRRRGQYCHPALFPFAAVPAHYNEGAG